MMLGFLAIAVLCYFLAPQLLLSALQLGAHLIGLVFACAGLFVWTVIALAVVTVAFRIVFG